MKFLLALLLPGFMVVFFSKIVYNQYLGLILTVALIAASVYKGYTDTTTLIVIDAFSLTAGFYFANQMAAKRRKNT